MGSVHEEFEKYYQREQYSKILSEAKRPDGDITYLKHPEPKPFYKEEVSLTFFKTIEELGKNPRA